MGKFERRRALRAGMRPERAVALRYARTGQHDWLAAQTLNIGVGGAFILTRAPLPIGTPLSLEVVIGAGRTVALTAVVRWSDPQGESAGMGVQFAGVDVDVMLELNRYLTT